MQDPWKHVVPGGQVAPHALQFAGSEKMSTQLAPQQKPPAPPSRAHSSKRLSGAHGWGQRHSPLRQTCPAAQGPQPPQEDGSRWKSRQVPPQQRPSAPPSSTQ